MKQRTAFRQPKERKHAPKTPSSKVVNDRAWKASRRRRSERWTGKEDDWCTPARRTIEAAVIEEELFHLRELQDLAAIEEDGFGEKHHRSGTVFTTPHEAPKEAPMQRTPDHVPGPRIDQIPGTPRMPVGSLSQPRPSGRVSKKRPWRLAAQPEQPKLTLLPNPDDEALRRKQPIDPTTRKATRIIPDDPALTESVDWTIEDLVEDARLARHGA